MSITRFEVVTQTEKILTSQLFFRTKVPKKLLQYTVHREVSGEPPAKEYELATVALGYAEDFDPVRDSLVRVNFNRLRDKLKAYYASAGAEDDIVISYPARYGPSFRRRGDQVAMAPLKPSEIALVARCCGILEQSAHASAAAVLRQAFLAVQVGQEMAR